MSEQKRILFMLPALAIAGWLAFFADKTPPGEMAAPVDRAGSAPESGQLALGLPEAAGSAAEVSQPSAAGFGREGIRSLLDEENPANLFGSGKPPEPEQAAPQEPVVPPPNFRFIGRMLRDGGWNVFFDSDNATYVVTKGSRIKDYRIDAVLSNQVELTHLPSKSTHIIPIEGDQ